jgi:fumarate reductase flavoprotein subunit
MCILDPNTARFEASVAVLIVGGGGCGLTAALAAREHGVEVLVLERDPTPLGTTAMSTGLIPAAGSRFQREKGIDDSPERFADDILGKAQYRTDPDIVETLARESARTVEWLADSHGVPLSLVDSFLYPGHSVKRMHGTPNRTGVELMAALTMACARSGVDVLNQALASELFVEPDGNICGVRVVRPDGSAEDIACQALILACCGFAGNRDMVAEFIPEILHAEFFGHPGNKGDAIRWGRALGAGIRDTGAYQGHGGLAAGHGIPILWPLIVEGGFQVNATGRRFSNEARGYSEQAVEVVAQPGHVAWDIYDERLHHLMLEFRDYQDALEARAIVSAPDVASLARAVGLPAAALSETIAEVEEMVRGERLCPFGRDFTGRLPLAPPFHAVKVQGALFHTQGGLTVDAHGRVLREDGRAFANLFAGGGAARGISGPSCWGYIAGNGLLTATTLGRLAGENAARLVNRTSLETNCQTRERH